MILNIFLILICILAAIFIIAVITAIIEEDRAQRDYLKRNFADEVIERAIRSKDLIVMICCLFLFSCSPAARMNHYQKIHGMQQSDTFTIRTYKGITATFKELPRSQKFIVPAAPGDTLYPNKKIYITLLIPVKKAKDVVTKKD